MSYGSSNCDGSSGSVRPSSEGKDEIVEDEELESGVRHPLRLQDPLLPTEDERAEHDKSHLPFRSWCRHCVAGKGKEAPCKGIGELPSVPEFHMDFMFMGEEIGGRTLAFLIVKERLTKVIMGTVVPSKSTGEFVAKRVVAFMKEYGCEMIQVNVKSDGEPAIKTVVDNVCRVRASRGASRMCVENSPAYSHKSNGVIERGVQTIQGHLRVMRSALEARLGVVLATDHAIWAWMVEYVGYLICRGEVGRDGRTPYERSKGKRGKIPGVEFGEGIWWKRKPVGGALGKLTCLWSDGVFLGVKGTTGEYIVGTEDGVWRTRTLRRRPVQERWNADNLAKVGGVPWRTSEKDPNIDGEKLQLGVRVMDENCKEELAKEAASRQVIPRRFHITTSDLEELGYTMGCPGCNAKLRGTTQQKHSESCRKRIEEKLKDAEKVKSANEKINKYLEKYLEKAIEQDQKKRKQDAEDGHGKKVKEEDDVDMNVGDAESRSSGVGRNKRALGDMGDGVGIKERKVEKKNAKRGREDAGVEGDHRQDPDGDEVLEVVGRIYAEDEEEDKEEEMFGYPVNEALVNVAGMDGEMDDMREMGDHCDVKGEKSLDIEKVREGRRDEMEFMDKIEMFEYVPKKVCWERTGKPPVSTK